MAELTRRLYTTKPWRVAWEQDVPGTHTSFERKQRCFRTRAEAVAFIRKLDPARKPRR
jgi:hypothetical protein